MSAASTTLIKRVLKMAKHTFARSPLNKNKKRTFLLTPDEFTSSLKELKLMMNELKSTDLGLDRSEALTINTSREKHEAPVTYIKIHEDKDVSIGIFIVKSGFRIPLHNHPNMNGLLKVVYGNVDVKVYTKWVPSIPPIELPPFLQDKTHLIDQGLVVPCSKNVISNVDSSFETFILSPDTNNYHEILTVGDGPAAFFDILAPPYHTDTSSTESDTPDEEDEHEEIRECFFFAELNFGPSKSKNNIHSEKSNIVWLRRVKSPDDYYCDTESYLGPSLLSD